MPNLLERRTVYKPFNYPWAYEAFKQQNKIHWLPEEVPLREDIRDWNSHLSDAERNLLSQLFRFFTQGDIAVAEGYLHKYIPIFAHQPELSMMMSAFANMEAVHIDAYSNLIETIGMPETEYQAFRDYEQMKAKYDYLESTIVDSNDKESIALSLAIYSAFTEGLQLFSSFAILLNFPRQNKMKGMGKIVMWSQRDESLHVENMIQLFRTFIGENPELWTDEFKKQIYQACRDCVTLEDNFIDLVFEQGGIDGLTPSEVKEYIRYIADRRLLQLGLKPNFKVKKNPLEWLDMMVDLPEHTNFFENRATEYSKGMVVGWGEVFN